MKSIVKFIIAIGIPLLTGAISGLFTAQSVAGWYATIIKPSFNPPNWVFGTVWTILYIMMGIAFFLVWKSNDYAAIKRTAIIFYFIQLTLNFLWSFIFFYSHQPGWALIDIICLWLMILITMLYFGNINSIAGWLMLPYICWVSFASALNYAIWKLN